MRELTLAYHHPVRAACDRCAWAVFSSASLRRRGGASRSCFCWLRPTCRALSWRWPVWWAWRAARACRRGSGWRLQRGAGLHWALTPFLQGTSIRPLYPEDYRAIEAMIEPSWHETLAQWARHQPKFDTRHLEACERAYRDGPRGQAVPEVHRPSFRGKDAWDLCDGLIGRMVQASCAAERLETGTDPATTPPAQDAPPARRL